MEIITKKVIVEVRFAPILRFREVVYDYFQSLISEYTSLGEKQDSITLSHDIKGVNIFCLRQRAGIGVENVEDFATVLAELKKLDGLLGAAKVKKFIRLGIRIYFLTPLGELSYKKAIELYADNQLQLGNLVLDKPSFEDFAITLDGKSGDTKVKIHCGIVNRHEIQANLSEFAFENDPEVALLHDIDNFYFDVICPLKDRMISTAYNRSKNLVKQYHEQQGKTFNH